MSEPSEVSDDGGTVIPESLLAIAKDGRYVKECEDLLLRVLHTITPWLSSRGVIERGEQNLQPTAAFFSPILYSVLVLARTRRTAGMQVCNLEFSESLGRWKLVAGAMASAAWIYGMRSGAAFQRPSNSSEWLTGVQRRQAFEDQRQEMVRRAATASSAEAVPTADVSSLSSERGDSMPATCTVNATTIFQRFRSLVEAVAKSLEPALSSEPEGPHAIQDVSGRSSNARTLGMWLVRLHLALYCINGQFPSIIHRLLYRQPLRLETGRSTALVHRPDSARIVGLLIATQAAWTLVQSVSRAAIYWWVDTTSALTPSDSSSQSCSIRFQGQAAIPVETENTCAICHQIRRFPACPVACGHVFCWHCLQQWVASNAAACPLCRKPSAARDIMLLYNYDGASTAAITASE